MSPHQNSTKIAGALDSRSCHFMRLPRLCFPCPISWPRILCIWAHSERANPGLVFDDVLAAGPFAILLRDMVRDTDWNSKGVTTTLSRRVSLHTGPVLLCGDPIVRHMTITGAHVSHTARIEPTVTPDEIWACESFPAQTAIASL